MKRSKQLIRKSILELRNKQPHERVIQKSEQILKNLFSMKEYQTARVVMLYCGKMKEIQTEKLIKYTLKEKRVVLPITNVKKRILELSEIKDYDLELEEGTFGILEPKKEFIRPINIELLDLIIVPGVSFDYKGNRLGYGHAYFDKLLKTIPKPIPFIGIAFQFQIKNKIPHSQYDVSMHYIVTEEQIINCR